MCPKRLVHFHIVLFLFNVCYCLLKLEEFPYQVNVHKVTNSQLKQEKLTCLVLTTQ